MFAIVLLLPLVTAWNLFAPPNRSLKIGPKLAGVTYALPLTMSWTTIRDGSLQKAIAERIAEAFAFRPMLIRINNQIRYELFGELDAPEVVRGAKGQLFGKYYMKSIARAPQAWANAWPPTCCPSCATSRIIIARAAESSST
jgi:alginate O-acetyltransferase complex protein AlgJ